MIVTKISDDLWLGVKSQSNLVIAVKTIEVHVVRHMAGYCTIVGLLNTGHKVDVATVRLILKTISRKCITVSGCFDLIVPAFFHERLGTSSTTLSIPSCLPQPWLPFTGHLLHICMRILCFLH